MRKGIAVAGTLSCDAIKYIATYPPRYQLTKILDTHRALGGLVCNCGLTLAKMDPALSLPFYGALGEDENGDYILGEFAKYPNIDASAIRRQGVTCFTDVMSEADGGRTFFHFKGANAGFCPEDIDLDKLASKALILHIGYLLLMEAMDAPDPQLGTRLCQVLKGARERGVLTSIDVVSEDSDRYRTVVPPALPYADLVIINEIEAERVTGIATRDGEGALLAEGMARAAERLLEMGVQRWAVLHAPEMACGARRGAKPLLIPSFKLPQGFIKSTVGAGDAFAAGVLYGVYNAWTLERAMEAGHIAAAFSLSGAGGADAIQPYGDMEDAAKGWEAR